MSIISPYNSFMKEGFDDDLLSKFRDKKKCKLFITPAFKKILDSISLSGDFQSREIANYIKNIDTQDVNRFDISYIDINKDKPDYVTFLPSQRAWREMGWSSQEEADVPPSPNSPIWNAKGRQDSRMIPFLTKICDDSFQLSAMEKFVIKFKAEIQGLSIFDKFKLITGEEIRHWYACSNYYKDPNGKDGGLPGSCMRYDGVSDERGRNTQPFLDIYCKNPDKCSMLILTNEENKLIGRALVWKGLRKPYDENKKPTLWLMDRIYTNRASDYELFKKYAKGQGWLYKPDQTAQCDSYMDGDKKYNKSMSIVIKPSEYKYYPFMDTFRYYNPKTGRLSSHAGNPVSIIDENGKQIRTRRITLTQTNGTYGQFE